MRILILALLLLFCSPAVQAQGNSGGDTPTIVTIDGQSYYVHPVNKGETIYSLARKYGITEKELVAFNPEAREGLRTDHVLKIPVRNKEEKKLTNRQRNRLFDTHIVTSGETLYGISKLYNISVNTVLEDNPGLDPSSLSIGKKISIRKLSVGDADPERITEELEEYRDAINSVSADVTFHLVESGETIYGLSRLYGIEEEEIIRQNDLGDRGLRTGDMIKIPVRNILTDVDFNGQQADSLLIENDRDNLRRPVHPGLSVKDISSKTTYNISLLLPLRDENNKTNNGFVEFYQGVRMALEDLREEGISSNLTLFNTGRSRETSRDIITSKEFQSSDLIIGPVYEDIAGPFVEFAEDRAIAMVSPLAVFQQMESPVFFQMSPWPDKKYDKLKEIISAEEVKVIYIVTSGKDEEMESQVRPFLPPGSTFIEYSRGTSANVFQNAIDKTRHNIFIVSCLNEFSVDEILAKLSSMQNNITARTGQAVDMRIIGNSRWSRFRNNIDRDLFFKLNLCYITSYHADRSNAKVKAFDSRHINTFGTTPTLYTYRGYDTAYTFVKASSERGGSLDGKLNDLEAPLQVSYNFQRDPSSGNHLNTEWMMVCYKSNYSIEVH